MPHNSPRTLTAVPDQVVVDVATQLTVAQIRAGLVSAEEISATFADLVRNIATTLTKTRPDTTTGNVLAFPTQRPAVPIKESVTPDHLVCLEDGRKVKMLRRYLRRFDLTPEQYRSKWGLPNDYPMTAPNLTERKRTYAKLTHLGKHARN